MADSIRALQERLVQLRKDKASDTQTPSIEGREPLRCRTQENNITPSDTSGTLSTTTMYKATDTSCCDEGTAELTADYHSWMQKIQDNGNIAEDWLAFTDHVRDNGQFTNEAIRFTYITRFYSTAIKKVPFDIQKGNRAFAQLLLNFANFKSLVSVDQARNLYSQARSAVKCLAMVHIAAAQFELDQGKPSKSKVILQKAVQLKSQPEAAVVRALASLAAGDTQLLAAADQQQYGLLVGSIYDGKNSLTLNSIDCSRSLLLMKSSKSESQLLHPFSSRTVPSGIGEELAMPMSAKKSTVAKNIYTDYVQPQPHNVNVHMSSIDRGGSDPDHIGFKPPLPQSYRFVYKDQDSCPDVPGAIKYDLQDEMTCFSKSRQAPPPVPENLPENTVCFITDRRRRGNRSAGNTSDESETIPLAFDKMNGEYQRRPLNTHHSTPNLRTPALSHFSSTKKTFSKLDIGLPRRVPVKEAQLSDDSDDSSDSAGLAFPHSKVLESDTVLPDMDSHNEDNKTCRKDSAMSQDQGDTHSMEVMYLGNEGDSGVLADTNMASAPVMAPSNVSSTGSTLQSLQPMDTSVSQSTVFTANLQKSSTVTQPASVPSTSTQPPAPVVVATVMPAKPASLVRTQAAPPQPSQPQNKPPPQPAPAAVPPPSSAAQPAPRTHGNSLETMIINGQTYIILKLLGKGGFSQVYEAYDPKQNLRAVKCIDFKTASSKEIDGFKNEIALLKRLQYSDKVVKLFDYEYQRDKRMLYVVMERGDTDLASLFRSQVKQGAMNPLKRMFYWMEMLASVQVLHKEGIVHSDLKPANFLLVAGNLKLIDFGIAKSIQQDMTSVICDQQVGTLNYMSPEAIMDTCAGEQVDEKGQQIPRLKIGVKSDVWSLGCILYNLVYKKTPFQHVPNDYRKLHVITNDSVKINFPEIDNTDLLDVLKRCLVRDAKKRPSIEELLAHPYLRICSSGS